jgi:hypothetical protein
MAPMRTRNPTAVTEQAEVSEMMKVRQSGGKLYLDANRKEAAKAEVMILTASGQLIGKQSVNMNKGFNTVQLNLPASGQLRIVAITVAGERPQACKVIH